MSSPGAPHSTAHPHTTETTPTTAHTTHTTHTAHSLSPPPTTSSSSSSSLQSLTSSSDSSTLSTPFESLQLEDSSPEPFLGQDKDRSFFDHAEQTYDADAEPFSLHQPDASMFEMMKRESPRSTPCGTPSQHNRPTLHHSHTSFHIRTPRSPTLERERPALVHRNTSYTKRHASFDSPREVPLPSMQSSPHSYNHSTHPTQEDHPELYLDHMGRGTAGLPSGQASGAPTTSDFAFLDSSPDAHIAAEQSQPPRPASPSTMDTTDDDTAAPSSSHTSPLSSPQPFQQRRMTSGPIPLQGGRPISAQEPPRPIYSPTPVRAGTMSDRSSTISLPLPMHTPYHTLPSVQPHDTEMAPETESSSSSASTSTSSLASTSSDPQTPSSPSSSSSSRRPGYMTREYTQPVYSSSGIPYSFGKPDWLAEHTRPSASSSSHSLIMTVEEGYMPPPIPPTILTPPPPPSHNGHHHAPHEPFLAHASPRSTEIRVETSRREYKLIVPLPGYRRDSITLSARRRRILHVVADSWEPGGGHLERRISFGYDADLGQVRAEFDGELLRVTVPRRVMPMTYMEAQLS